MIPADLIGISRAQRVEGDVVWVERRHDLDWIRVICTAAVFVYHVMMYFNTWPWHAKNGVLTPAFQPLNLMLMAWIMPIFFLISGFAAHSVLERRSASGFLKERLVRLGVPLLLGVFVLSPIQVYSERITYGQFSGTFLQFLPRYFHGWYGITPGGNFAWMGLHLWYLLALLVFSVVTLPVLLRTRARQFSGPLDRLIHEAGPAGALLLPPVLVLGLEGFLHAMGWDGGQSGWPFGVYLAQYLLGFLLLPADGFRAGVRQAGRVAWAGVAITFVSVAFIPEPADFGGAFVVWHLAKACNSWWWIVGLLYLGDRHLNRNSRVLAYCNEAVLPFYVLHQPIIVTLGFALRAVPIPIAVKFPLLLTIAFASTVTLYHACVRPVGIMRFLCGMRPRDPAVPGSGRVDAAIV